VVRLQSGEQMIKTKTGKEGGMSRQGPTMGLDFTDNKKVPEN
jgi:hypothetical protein